MAMASPKRKRKRKLSPKQLARWLEKEADDSRLYNLTLDVNDLKHQLQTLAMQQSVLETRALVSRYTFTGAAMRTVDRFFQIFFDGFRAMQPDEERFVIASTDEAVALGTAAFGRDVLLQQWERYTRIFSLHAFINSSMTIMVNDPECTIIGCDGKFDGRISRETVEIVFPHILSDEALVQRVLGCKIRIPVKTLLYFDTAGCIVRYDAHVDVFQGLNDLLASNPRDVITMMAQAQINDASMIPDHAPVVDETPSVQVTDSCESPWCSSPASPSRFFPVDDDRHSVDYILSSP